MAHWRARSWVWSLVLVLIPSLPIPAGLGGAHVHRQSMAWSPGRSIVRSFFASILGSILDSCWIRFELVLGSFCPPFWNSNRVSLGPKCVLNLHFFENVDVHKTSAKPMRHGLFRRQDGSKIASRPVQLGSKRDKQVMMFSS